MTTDWVFRAACKGKTHLFFAPERERPTSRADREARAKAICEECPVQTECSEAAQEEEFGIWAGKTLTYG